MAGTVILVVLVGAGVLKRAGGQSTPVTTEKAVIKTITQIVTATGKIQPEIEVKISPEVYGEIIELPLREGDRVKKGDLLVKIKPDSYQAQVEQQEAAVNAARSAATLSNAKLEK
ncbi:MAG: biotin/lipoyl-binding protein, partial [Verrucomicrobiota bacterium]|nr:biotin/lipoyl-binding protein [Verrucomicrobiota bacterium]